MLPTSARLAELQLEPRCTPGAPQSNYCGGLIDLILEAQPDTVLEIGANRGVSTECFLLLARHVTVVDSWEGEWTKNFGAFVERTRGYRNLKIVRERSPQALEQFPAASFDLVYIDGDHDEESATRDIIAAQRVAKKWIAGHDFDRPGVIRAVHKILRPNMLKLFSDSSWLIDAQHH